MFFASSPSPSNYFRFFAKHPSGQVTGGIIRHADAYNKILRNLSSWNVYLGMNPATTWRGIKVRDDQISEVIGLVVDIDPSTDVAWAPSSVSLLIQPALEAVHSTLGRIPYTQVLATGRGLQLWLRVLPHPLHSEDDRFAWRGATRQFLLSTEREFVRSASGYRVDTSCSDLSRLVRAPFSINQRTQTKVEVLKTLEHPPINPTSFLELFPTEKPEPFPTPKHPSLKWWKSFHLLTTTAQRFIVEGVSEPGRHSAAYATAASLRDTGIGYKIAERLILHGAARCSPPLGFEDALRACSNAYRSERRAFASSPHHIAAISS